MWGEGASDLWGRLEREEQEREAELLEAVRKRLHSGSSAAGGRVEGPAMSRPFLVSRPRRAETPRAATEGG
jgi:hypothetical protein